MKFLIATNNKKKLREIGAILEKLGVSAVSLSEAGVESDAEETGTTFEENSLLKAKAVMEASGMAAIADDSGLEVDALDGAPGVYSARFGGLDSDEARTALLLEKLQGVPDEKRTARFVSVVTCVLPDGRIVSARGTCEGVIAHAPAGTNGFGYDPVFYVPGLGKTFSQASSEEKNAISQRGNALQKFCEAWKEAGLC